jgi:hypothetical protein
MTKHSVLADHENLFASKDMPFPPSEEELKREPEREQTEQAAIA